MHGLKEFLKDSYTAYQAVANLKKKLLGAGFTELNEGEAWTVDAGKGYFVTRNGSSLIAFRLGEGSYKIVASHTDSPCLKLKEHAETENAPYTRLNAEEYGGCILYSFLDRPLRLAGRVVRGTETGVAAEPYVSEKLFTIPSLAIHMNREVNDGFKPDRQTDMLPLFSLGKGELQELLGETLSYDLYLSPAAEPYESGAHGEFLSSPRLDDLVGVYGSLCALLTEDTAQNCVIACLDSEEIGSRTRQGAAGDFLVSVLRRAALSQGVGEEEFLRTLSQSLLVSLDNAHALHPNRPEKCDPTNRPVLGGGIVIKGHAGGAYTTDGLTSAIVKKIFGGANVAYQTFYNRSDMRSGSTLGAIGLSQMSVPSVDLGLAQLAMHSAVETMAKSDFETLVAGLSAIFRARLRVTACGADVE